MKRITKLFRKGSNQAVRLPVEFDTAQVYIRGDEQGNVILSKQSDPWQPFLTMLKNVAVPRNFLANEDRQQGITERDPFNNRF